MLISVVIPLYNKAHTIVNTLITVLCQTYQNFEVVIVDDGSTDNSVAIIESKFDDKRIRVIKQANGGVSAARNTGIKMAEGEWIAFLDADDEWLPEYLSTLMIAADDNPAIDLLICGRYGQNIITKKRRTAVPQRYTDKVTEINFFCNPHVFVHISATIIRTKLLKDNFITFGTFLEGQKSNEDFTFLYRVALHSRCIYVGKPLAIYNGGVEGAATTLLREQKKLEDNILMRNLVIDEWYATGRKNKVCGIFMKYETRHAILGRLKQNDYAGLETLINGMNNNCRQFYFGYVERKLLTTPLFNKIAILYLYATKCIWRLHGFPVVR